MRTYVLFSIALVFTIATTATHATVNDYDINAGWVQRLPVIPYTWGSTNPAVEGWPAVNSTVTWHAVVKNWHTTAFENVSYTWTQDGAIIQSGTVTLAPEAHTAVDLPWIWTFDRHKMTFTIDTENDIEEFSERNNRIDFWTDAITVGFWVEESLYEYFHTYQKDLNVGANSWEDWAQRHVRRWNEMFARAVYPGDTPDGVLDRIRLDQINIVPDDSLPLSGGLASNSPDRTNRTVDLQWGFVSDFVDSTFYGNHTSANDDNAFFFEQSLMHELGHARYLIDTYGFNFHDTDPDGSEPRSNIVVTVNGEVIVGTPYMPLNPPWWDSVYFPTRFGDLGYGLMSSPKTLVDHYSAMAMNLIAGHRATLGNYNSPGNIGTFMEDLPTNNIVTIRDSFGNPMPGATVNLYRVTYKSGDWYGKKVDDIPDITVIADTNSEIALGQCPFDDDGTIEHTYGKANGVMIVRVDYQDKIGFGFLDVMNFNMEYWRGNTETGRHEFTVSMIGNSFGIAGVVPHTGLHTPLSKVDPMEVIISGPTNASRVRINGVNASYGHGAWRRSNVSLSEGSNTFTIIADSPSGDSVTQTVIYIRKDTTPPIIGDYALIAPYPEEELMPNVTKRISWMRERLIDAVDDINVVVDAVDVVDAETGDELAVVLQNRGNSGYYNWTVEEVATPETPVALRFIVSDQSGNTTTQTFANDAFYVLPEPMSAMTIGILVSIAGVYRTLNCV